jgi:tRNA pseudouridine55 synthase
MTRPRKPATHHGYVVIDKPAGWTSHDVVARARRIVGEKRVGHAGTLDPAAVGVLPVAVGSATRTIQYLGEADKTYIADITFGVVTDSADIEGKVTCVNDTSHLTLAVVESVVESFAGEQAQVPPMHSAIKIGGKPLYHLARQGEKVDIPARQVTIYRLDILQWDPPTLRVVVDCSKGTYIRSLARDIGERAGGGAYLSKLVRTRVGRFQLEDAISLDQLALAMQEGEWERVARHPDVALVDHAAIVMSAEEQADWSFGRQVPAYGATGTVRVYDATGNWLGVGVLDPDTAMVRPVKVVHLNHQDPE